MKPIKCLIISDSHGRVDRVREALSRQRGVDAVLFLGDGIGDIAAVASAFPYIYFLCVRGNCDYIDTFLNRQVMKTDSITLGDKRIFLTHGDMYGVKYGPEGLYRLAESVNADIVLYGHTHIPSEEYRDGVYYFNPGSLYGGTEGATCGVMTLTDGGVLFSLMRLG